MTWSFTGISYPVECVYTQTRGVHPDLALLKFLPQVGNFPTNGTLTFQWDASSVTLPSCVVDTSSLQYHADGIHHIAKVWDRRERWKNAAPISGYYNVSRAGIRVAAKEKTLRQLVTILLTQLGEGSANVSAVPATVYPQVRWINEATHLVLEALLKEHGLDLTLGFGSDAVTIVVVGSGSALPVGNEFMAGLTADPKLRPRWIRTVFGPSRMQARFELEAVGLESDGEWLPIDELTYAPAGTLWSKEDPYNLPTVLAATGLTEWALGMKTVFRSYRVKQFSDGTLNLPDGSLTISDISDILPLVPHLLDTEDLRLGDSYRPFRVFGRHYREVKERGQPSEFENTAKTYNLEHVHGYLDVENGVVTFEHPVFLLNTTTDSFEPAELWLECTFTVKDQTTFAPITYSKDTSLDVTGYGYHTIRIPEQHGTSVIAYDSDHIQTGATTNQTALDALAAAEAAIAAASLSSSLSEVKVYSIPKLTIRCDGAIMQVQHVMTNGEGSHAVNRTTASRFREFDRGIPSQAQRFSHSQSIRSSLNDRWKQALNLREDESDE